MKDDSLPLALLTLFAIARSRPGARYARFHAWRQRRRDRRAARLARNPTPEEIGEALDQLSQQWQVDL